MGQSGIKSLDEALDAVSWELFDHPFGISRPCSSFSLSILNRDHNAASRQEELARKLGRGWIDDRVNRHHIPANQLIDVQTTLFELIWSGTVPALQGNLARSTNDPEHREFEVILDQLDKSLQGVIGRSKRPRFTLTFYGMVKAGKSLLLNSLIGNIVLPSIGRYPWNSKTWSYAKFHLELPSTVWPCRLVHVKGRKEPELCVRTELFNKAIKCLREKCYSAQMEKYRPPTISVFGSMFGDDLDSEGETSPEANKLREIYHEWKGLHIVTQSNLLTFEQPGFQLRHQVSGVETVSDLVSLVIHFPRLLLIPVNSLGKSMTS